MWKHKYRIGGLLEYGFGDGVVLFSVSAPSLIIVVRLDFLLK